MSETKTWAFINEFGSERITAREVSHQRAPFGGRRLGKTYWSTHDIGSRQALKHVQRKHGLPFFSYMDGTSASAGDGGESLSHALYKEAIARLTKTQLRLRKGNHDIRIIHAETEKEISLPTGEKFRADVYCKFESESALANKWGGEVYIEVCHMHPVPVDKIKRLQEHRLALIEVKVAERFLYQYDGDTTTKEFEEEHVNFLLGRFEEFLVVCDILSNPSSIEYLERQVRSLATKIIHHEKQTTLLTGAVTDLNSAVTKLKDENTSLIAQNRSLKNRVAMLDQAALKSADKITRLNTDSNILRGENETLRSDLKYRKFLLMAGSAALITCLVCLLCIPFIDWRAEKDFVAQSTANDQPDASSNTLPVRTNAPSKPYEGKPEKPKARVKKINRPL